MADTSNKIGGVMRAAYSFYCNVKQVGNSIGYIMMALICGLFAFIAMYLSWPAAAWLIYGKASHIHPGAAALCGVIMLYGGWCILGAIDFLFKSLPGLTPRPRGKTHGTAKLGTTKSLRKSRLLKRPRR